MNGKERSAHEDRIKKLVRELRPELEPYFDDESPNIKFVVRAKFSNTHLTSTIEWRLEELEKMTDDEVKKHMKTRGAGRI